MLLFIKEVNQIKLKIDRNIVAADTADSLLMQYPSMMQLMQITTRSYQAVGSRDLP